MAIGQHKKICSKCGKIIGYNEKCECKGLKSLVVKVDKKDDGFYSTYRWRKLRKRIIDRDKCHCQRCWYKWGIIETDNLQAHHIKSRAHHPELEYDEDNLITLCQRCNLQLGTKDKLDFEWCVPSEEIEFNL